MVRTTYTVADVFALMLTPVADAFHAETGKQLRPTVANVVNSVRTRLAGLLRRVADRLAPVAVEVPHPAPVMPEPEPVAVPVPVPPAPEPAPLAAVASEQPVPYGWSSLALPAPVAKVAKPRKPKAVKPAPVQVEEPAKVWTVSVISSVHHIPAKTVRNHLASGALRGTKGADGWTVTDADLDAYLAGRKQPTK